MIPNNLAISYRNRSRGDKAGNLAKAINHYHNALTIYTKEDEPLNCLKTARNLGILYYNEKQWQLATEAYHTAIEAVENNRLEALNPQSRQEVLSNAIEVFDRIVQTYLNLNQQELNEFIEEKISPSITRTLEPIIIIIPIILIRNITLTPSIVTA